jgi:two-component system alkaline phosphatase synthesis response regulator PhoP
MGKKILIADDEPDMITILEFRLKKKGYEILIAANGAEALAKARAIVPDLVILDYRMPILNGLEVCQQLQTDPQTKNIPVLLLTASVQNSMKIDYTSLGIRQYIVKPFEPEILLAAVEEYIR